MDQGPACPRTLERSSSRIPRSWTSNNFVSTFRSREHSGGSMRKLLILALAATTLAGAEAAVLPGSPFPGTELFPVEPGINAERGFAVAVDGDWLAMGAPRDDEEGKDAGAVYLFHWSGTIW